MNDSYPSTETVQPTSASSIVSVVCGITACVLNLFLITSPLGIVSSIVALVSGLLARPATRGGRAGLALAAVSWLILLIYAASALVPLLVDPTLQSANK